MISWQLDPQSNLPVYKQLVFLVQRAIESGELRTGQELPSQRQLAEILQLSRSTIVKAMQEMESAGLISLNARSKAIVSDLRTKGVQWDVYFRRSGHRYCKIQKSSRIDGAELNLSRLSLSEEYRPLESCMQVLSDIKVAIGDFGGLPRDYVHGIAPLQEAMLKYLHAKGIACQKDELLLLASPVQAISFVAELLLTHGVKLYYSSPSDIEYFGYLEASGASFIPLPYDSEGVLADLLMEEGNPRNDKVLFVWSSCSPPTNVSLSKARRNKLLRICSLHNIPIIDNCMLEPYNISREGIFSLKAADKAGSVIQIGAFPRGMAPGTWLSWVVANRSVIQRLEDIKEKRFRSLDTLSQAILNHLLREGSLQQYHEQVRLRLKEQTPFNNALIEKYLGDIADWDRHASGWCFWLKFKDPIDTKLLYEAKTGIYFNAGFLYDSSDRDHIMLNPPSLTASEFERALKKLREQILLLFPEAFTRKSTKNDEVGH